MSPPCRCARRRSNSRPSCCRRRPPISTSSTAPWCAANGSGGGPSITLGEIAKRVAPGSKLLRGRDAAARGARLVQHRPHGLSLRRALAVVRVDRDTGKVDGRALHGRLRRRPRRQSDAGRGPARRRLRAGARRRAARRSSSTTTNGEPLSVTFADYLMPTLRDVPDVEVLLTEDAPSPAPSARPQGRAAKAASTAPAA